MRTYFAHDFERERNTTLPALAARLDFLLRDAVLCLSFGSDKFVDLRMAMDDGIFVLINTGGPRMPRLASRVTQSLILSDLRQAVFTRVLKDRPYFWFLDEAQALFGQRADVENLTSLLTMSRSFGGHLVLMTQSVVAACPDRAFLQQLETNVRWLLMFRTGPEDARLLETAVPVTGRVIRHRDDKGRTVRMRADQERRMLLRRIPNLPERTAYLWLRGTDRFASRIHLPLVGLPTPSKARSINQCVSANVVEQELAKQERRLRELVLALTRGRRGREQKVEDILTRLEQRFQEPCNDEPR